LFAASIRQSVAGDEQLVSGGYEHAGFMREWAFEN
jgi:hypothetical protein